MPRTAIDTPLDAQGRADVERAWHAVQPTLAAMRLRYPRLDIDGIAALRLCRYLRRHDRGRDRGLERYAQDIVRHAPSQAARALEPCCGLVGDPVDRRTPGTDEADARGLLAGLRRSDAETLWMWAVEGVGYREICRRTGRSEFDVRAALRRARATLRGRLEGTG